MENQPFSLQAPEAIAKKYGGNKQKIAMAAQNGLLDPTAAVMAGMFIDRMRSAEAAEQVPQQTVAQQVLTPKPAPAPTAPAGLGAMVPGGMPPMAPPMGGYAPPPMPMPQEAPPMTAADGGLMSSGGLSTLPVPNDMFDEPDGVSMADGGIVAFGFGGSTYMDPLSLLEGVDRDIAEEREREQAQSGYIPFSESLVGRLLGQGAGAANNINANVQRQQETGKVIDSRLDQMGVLAGNTGSSLVGGLPKTIPDSYTPKKYTPPKRYALTNVSPDNLDEKVKPKKLGDDPSKPIDLSVKGRPQPLPGQYFTYGGKNKDTVYREPQRATQKPAVATPAAKNPEKGLALLASNISKTTAPTAAKPVAAAIPGKPGEYYGMSTDAVANMEKMLKATGGASPIEERLKALTEANMSPEALAKQKKNDLYAALGQMGFNMAANKSPYFLQALGEAGSATLPALQKAEEQRKAREMEGLKTLYGFEAEGKARKGKAYEFGAAEAQAAAKGMDANYWNSVDAGLKREGLNQAERIAWMQENGADRRLATQIGAGLYADKSQPSEIKLIDAMKYYDGALLSDRDLKKELKNSGLSRSEFIRRKSIELSSGGGGGGGGGGAVDNNNPLLNPKK